jgi:hypothetical protein
MKGTKSMKKRIYYFRAECEHEGDVDREMREITEGDAAKIVDVDIPPHGDCDYYVTIYFEILDAQKFEEATGYSPSDFSSYEK